MISKKKNQRRFFPFFTSFFLAYIAVNSNVISAQMFLHQHYSVPYFSSSSSSYSFLGLLSFFFGAKYAFSFHDASRARTKQFSPTSSVAGRRRACRWWCARAHPTWPLTACAAWQIYPRSASVAQRVNTVQKKKKKRKQRDVDYFPRAPQYC